MKKQELLETLSNLMQQFDEEHEKRGEKIKIIFRIRDFIEEYLREHPKDTDVWFKRALLYNFLDDQITSVECMDKILTYDPQNAYARILSACFMDLISVIDDVQFEKIKEFMTDDNEINSIIEYVKSIYYNTHENKELEEEALKKSVQYSDKHVKNHEQMASICIQKENYIEASRLLLIALSNIQHIGDGSCSYDILDINRFLSSYVTGTRTLLFSYRCILGILKTSITSSCKAS